LSTVTYTYDPIGQLKIADSSVNSEDRGYTYDSAWNLNWRTNNGSASSFKVDNKNQLTNACSSQFNYDANGNLVTNNCGFYALVYDDENRLTMVSSDFYHTFRSTFTYDGLGRLRKRIDFDWEVPGAGPGFAPPPVQARWVATNTVLYIYDGWRVIQERDTNNVPTVSYTRGNDLSGSLEGAGGIGGLLARTVPSTPNPQHSYYFADGNGNITYMLNSSQAMVANYRYDPFGNTISSSGTLADANVYRFSSKEIHLNSGMYYYGYRFYDPNLQRWINRDPIQEWGGENLYRFVNNNSLYFVDSFGLWPGWWCMRGPSKYQPVYDYFKREHDYYKIVKYSAGQPLYFPPMSSNVAFLFSEMSGLSTNFLGLPTNWPGLPTNWPGPPTNWQQLYLR
jgi:RHS repeat-associated protein